MLVATVAAAGIQSAAAQALRSSLDENWRGAYDIVVTAPGGLLTHDGLLPPNSLTAVAGGMSLADVERVRRVEGVEVAAPIGEILAPGIKYGFASLAIPAGFVTDAAEAPQLFRVTATYATDDGLGERLVDRSSFPLVINESDREDPDIDDCLQGESSFQGRMGSYPADPERYPDLLRAMCLRPHSDTMVALPTADAGWMGYGPDAGAEFVEVHLRSAPQTVTRITLVDPVAEQRLLGAQGGFLDPLIATAAAEGTTTADMSAWAAQAGGEHAERFQQQLSAWSGADVDIYSAAAMAQLRQLFRDNGDDWDEMMLAYAADLPYLPLIVSDADAAALELKLDIDALGTVERVGDEYSLAYDIPDDIDAVPGRAVGSVVADVSMLLNPFSTDRGVAVWPGAELAIADRVAPVTTNQLIAVGRSEPQEYEARADGVALPAAGYATPLRENAPRQDALTLQPVGATPGAEAAYTAPDELWVMTGGEEAPLAVPVGSFSPDEVGVAEDAANYVPLGAYAPVSSTVTDGENAGVEMLPSMTGLGLVSPRTVAIGSLYSADGWDDATPVSAVRVRVADVDGYTLTGQQRVVSVAQAIEALGFSVSIVAGSSPADVAVHVDGYAFGTDDPDGTQQVGPLGTVTQRWSELGAASRVSVSVSSATFAILGLALASGILLLGAVQVAGVPGRRAQAGVMREVGFTWAGIARWFAAEEVPALVAVVGAGVLAWVVSGGTGLATVAAVSAVSAVVVTSAVAVVAGAQPERARATRDRRSRRFGATSASGFGARQVLVHPVTSLTHVLAIVIVGLSTAALAAALLAGRAAAGRSSLAELVTDAQLVPQLALGGTGIVAGVLLARLTRRLDLTRRAEQWAVLRAAGWTSGQLGAAQRSEGLTLALPACALTAVLTWFGASGLDLDAPALYMGAALAAALVAALIVFSTRRKGTVA